MFFFPFAEGTNYPPFLIFWVPPSPPCQDRTGPQSYKAVIVAGGERTEKLGKVSHEKKYMEQAKKRSLTKKKNSCQEKNCPTLPTPIKV